MAITAGIDLGSTATKAAVLKDDNILGTAILPADIDLDKVSRECLEKALSERNISIEELDFIVSTGYGRKAIDLADKDLDEIYAKAVAVDWLGSPWGPVRTLIDIGGQDSKVLSFTKDGELRNFVMNDRCAAGTGRFLEVMADALGVEIDELGELSLQSEERIEISSTCIVMAESEVVSLVARKKKREDIIAAIHRSVADRVGKFAKSIGVKEVVFFEGGPARNIGLKKALEDKLKVELYVPPNPQITASIGAALEGLDILSSENDSNKKDKD